MAEETPERPEGVRVLIRDVLNEDGRREKIEALVDSAFELRRLAWGFCPGCKQKVQVEIPDLKSTVGVLVDLLAEAEGKPGTADVAEAGLTLVVERVWPDAK